MAEFIQTGHRCPIQKVSAPVAAAGVAARQRYRVEATIGGTIVVALFRIEQAAIGFAGRIAVAILIGRSIGGRKFNGERKKHIRWNAIHQGEWGLGECARRSRERNGQTNNG